jgi:hypothetical protein
MPGLYKVSAYLGRGERGIISTVEALEPQIAINQSKRAHRGRYSHYRAENWDDPNDACWDSETEEDNIES